MQTGNREAAPRVNRNGDRYPSIGSAVAKFRESNRSAVPPYVAFQKSPTHIGYAACLGQQYNPFMGNQASVLPVLDMVGNDSGTVSKSEMFQFTRDLSFERIEQRMGLLRELDHMRRELDGTCSVAFNLNGVELVSGKALAAGESHKKACQYRRLAPCRSQKRREVHAIRRSRNKFHAT